MRLERNAIDQNNAAALWRELREAARADAELDLSALSALDSAAVALALAWTRAALARGARPRLTGLPGKMVTLCRLYGVWELLEPYATVREH